MANIYEIASYLEAGLTIKGYDVERRIGLVTNSILICAENSEQQHINIRISSRLIFDPFNTDSFYFVSSFEDAERLMSGFYPLSY